MVERERESLCDFSRRGQSIEHSGSGSTIAAHTDTHKYSAAARERERSRFDAQHRDLTGT